MSIKAGPATDTQITYAAVVGTSIPKTIHANAVIINAGQSKPLEEEIIIEVILIPNPVIPNTPTIIDAHNIIDAIIAICLPAKIEAVWTREKNFLKSNFKLISINNNMKAINMADEAANWGVKPLKSIISKVTKGILWV